MYVEIKNVYITLYNFSKVLEVKQKLNKPLYLTHIGEPNKAMKFEVGGCEIIVMPIIKDYYGFDDDVVIKLDL
jgi:phosphoribosyl 1,2-cyclic phosphodiesterase